MLGLKKPPELKSKLQLLGMLGLLVIVMYVLKAGCIIKRLTGIDCPGCGMTRAVLSLLRGDVQGAFSYHGMVWSLPVLLLLFLYDGYPFRKKWVNWGLWGLIGSGFMINWGAKFF